MYEVTQKIQKNQGSKPGTLKGPDLVTVCMPTGKTELVINIGIR